MAIGTLRIPKELAAIKKDGVHEFRTSDDTLHEGIAMIVGPADSPYFGGFYFYEVKLPGDYPMRHPKMKFLTNGKGVGFHPNMYIDGKICLSIVGGWEGPPWTPSWNLFSLFNTIASLLSENAMTHEPGVNASMAGVKEYDLMLEAVNIDIAVCEQLLNPPLYAVEFIQSMDARFLCNYDKLLALCISKSSIATYFYRGYGGTYEVNWKMLLDKLQRTKDRVISRMV